MLNIKFRFRQNHRDGFPSLGTLDYNFIDLTNRCNLNCLYCFNYGSAPSEPFDLALPVFEKMIHDPVASQTSSWILSGGEPVLYPHLDELLALFQQNGISPKIASNGSLLSPDIIEKWVDYGVSSVQISIDTLDKNRFSLLKGADPSLLEDTLSSLKYLSKTPIRTVVSSVITRLNYKELSEMMMYFSDLGIDSYTVYIYTPGIDISDMRPYILSPTELLGISEHLIQFYYDHFDAKVIDLNLPWIKNSLLYKTWSDKLDFRTHGCGGGRFKLSIKANGDAGPCICQSTREFIVGNIYNKTLSELWQSDELQQYRADILKLDQCHNCDILDFCRGGCRSNAYVFGKMGMKSEDLYCKTFRHPA